MAIINNSQGLFITLPVNTKYDPTNPGVEDFPTHYDQNGYGGFVAVNSSISEVAGASSLTGKYNLIIPTKRRKDGMMIYDINPEVASFYQCTDATAGFWEEVNFKFRYFYGATAPTAPDIQVGEKWFDTIVGSEYTYLPVAEGSSNKAWVDIDHIGEGETFSGYITVALANTYYVNVGGDEMTGSLTADKVFRGSSDVDFEDDEFVTKSFVFANFAESSGGVFAAQITGTSAVFSQGVTATKYNATGAITENTQLATKQYVDESGINIHVNDDTNPFGTEVTAFSISGGSNITIDYDQSTTPNRFVISSTLEVADEFVNIGGDTMTGTLTGTDASFDLIDIGVMSLGQTAYQGIENPNVPRIQSQGGVLIGGNTLAKQNWLGNNVYLAPEGYVVVGVPNNVPSGWFAAGGATYPFDLYSLNVTGGIHTDRAFRWGHKRGFGTKEDNYVFLDQEFITKEVSIMKPLEVAGSNTIQYHRKENAGGFGTTLQDFLFASLTKDKLGFDFPVDVTVRAASGSGGGGNVSTKWFVKTIANVSPTSGGSSININVDRDKQISFAGGDNDVAQYVVNENKIVLGGYVEQNGNVGHQIWWFLDIRPSPI